jgi:hypothetical protein
MRARSTDHGSAARPSQLDDRLAILELAVDCHDEVRQDSGSSCYAEGRRDAYLLAAAVVTHGANYPGLWTATNQLRGALEAGVRDARELAEIATQRLDHTPTGGAALA